MTCDTTLALIQSLQLCPRDPHPCLNSASVVESLQVTQAGCVTDSSSVRRSSLCENAPGAKVPFKHCILRIQMGRSLPLMLSLPFSPPFLSPPYFLPLSLSLSLTFSLLPNPSRTHTTHIHSYPNTSHGFYKLSNIYISILPHLSYWEDIYFTSKQNSGVGNDGVDHVDLVVFVI